MKFIVVLALLTWKPDLGHGSDEFTIEEFQKGKTAPKEAERSHFVTESLSDGDYAEKVHGISGSGHQDLGSAADIRWPNGVVFYQLSPSLRGSFEIQEKRRQVIAEAVRLIQRNTCVSFKPCGDCRNRLIFTTEGSDCMSTDLGMNPNGTQQVNIGQKCWSSGIVFHEIMHALGFVHEHQRKDRGQFLDVLFGNIVSNPRIRKQFEVKEHHELIGSFNYGSIMMYPTSHILVGVHPGAPFLKSKLGKPCEARMGQRGVPTAEDLRKINQFYECPDSKSCHVQKNKQIIGEDFGTLQLCYLLEECCDLCFKSEQCAGYNWKSEHGGSCLLKKTIDRYSHHQEYTSGVPVRLTTDGSCTMLKNTTVVSENIRRYHNRQVHECCGLCKGTGGCLGFAWNDYNGGTCWMKGRATAIAAKNGDTAGLVHFASSEPTCNHVQNTDLEGQNLKVVFGKQARECCSVCYNVMGCVGYSWSSYNNGACWLKATITGQHEKTGVVSSRLYGDDLKDVRPGGTSSSSFAGASLGDYYYEKCVQGYLYGFKTFLGSDGGMIGFNIKCKSGPDTFSGTVHGQGSSNVRIVTCAGQKMARGIRGTETSSKVSSLQLECKNKNQNVRAESAGVKRFSINCGNNKRVIGVHGREGAVIHKLSIICE